VAAALALVFGLVPSIFQESIASAAFSISTVSGQVYLTARGAAWATVVALAGPGLGLALYVLNRDCATWRWKVLGIQQSPVVATERWWAYLEQMDLYQALRLLVMGVARATATMVDAVLGQLAR
jgi:hypothetical protein